MPYDPTSPTLALCRDLAAAVAAAWQPTAPSGCDWAFFARFGDADRQGGAPELAGRQVVFFPWEFSWVYTTRAHNGYTHRVLCEVVERYTDGPGDVPRDWVAERVDFVHGRIVRDLRFNQNGPPAWNRRLMTLEPDGPIAAVDVKKLVGSGRLFYALCELKFLELVR